MSAAQHSSPAPQDPSSSPLPGTQSSPAGGGDGEDGRLYCLTEEEWSELHEVAMSFHGVMSLLKQHGFDNSTGAEELLGMSHRRFESLLASIRRRLEDD